MLNTFFATFLAAIAIIAFVVTVTAACYPGFFQDNRSVVMAITMTFLLSTGFWMAVVFAASSAAK